MQLQDFETNNTNTYARGRCELAWFQGFTSVLPNRPERWLQILSRTSYLLTPQSSVIEQNLNLAPPMQAIVQVLAKVAQRTPLVRSRIHVDQPVAACSFRI